MPETSKQINREQLRKLLAKKLNISENKADETIISFFELLHEEVMDKDAVIVLRPWGKFYCKRKAAKSGISPKGGRYHTPGRLVMHFEPFQYSEKNCEGGTVKEVAHGPNADNAPKSGSDI
jgi:nucleoid DNA-binding protein